MATDRPKEGVVELNAYLEIARRREYLTLANRINDMRVPEEEIESWLEREAQSSHPTVGAWGWNGHYKLQYRLAPAIMADVRSMGVSQFLSQFVQPDDCSRWSARVDESEEWNIEPLLKLMHSGGGRIFYAGDSVLIQLSEGVIAVKEGLFPAADGSHYLDLLLFNWHCHRREWRRIRSYLVHALQKDVEASTIRLTAEWARAVAVTSDGHAVKAQKVFRREGQEWVDITRQARAEKISIKLDAFELRQRTYRCGRDSLLTEVNRAFDRSDEPALFGGNNRQVLYLV